MCKTIEGSPRGLRGRIGKSSALFFLLLAAACKGESRVASTQGPVRSCAVDAECLAQELCVFRLCSPVCFGDNNCATGAACLETGRGAACVRLQDNACVADTDCPEATLCELGHCTSRCGDAPGTECLPGRTCVDGHCQAALTEDAGSPAVEDPEAGPAVALGDAGVEDASAAPLDCPPGSAQCDEQVVTRCDDLGAPVPEENCPYLCRDGACTGMCTPGELRCEDKLRQECSGDGVWVEIETCPTICTPDACESACDEGAQQCNGNLLMRCTNGEIVEESDCEFVCRDGACTGECEPGAKECRNNSVVTCNGEGRWAAAVSCPNACSEGACEGVCVPGTQRCGGASGTQLCSDDGRWGDTMACDNQACVQGSCTGICSPGETECTGDGSQRRCGPEGQWAEGVPCAAGTCVDGGCTGDCRRDARRCKPNSEPRVQTCDGQGRWQDGQTCEDRACFEGQCRGSCAPESRRCDSSDRRRFQICDEQGQWGDSMSCEAGEMCADEGECGQDTQTDCELGQGPDWSQGGDRSLNDPRWQGAQPMQTWSDGIGYTVVFDRAANTLAVQFRVPEGLRDRASAEDLVYFGVGDERPTVARAALVPLIDPAAGGGDPRALSVRQGFTWTEGRGDWSDVDGRDTDWIRNVSAWLDSDDASWAVALLVDLEMAEVDTARPIRLALGIRVMSESALGGQPADYSTPASSSLEMLPDIAPGAWRTTNLEPIECAGRLANF